jgi:hypothetical protein
MLWTLMDHHRAAYNRDKCTLQYLNQQAISDAAICVTILFTMILSTPLGIKVGRK